jgi:predicted nucleic acid-binding protein
MIFVDTNYFLRYFIEDGTTLHQDACRFFKKQSAKTDRIITSSVVVFEVYWVAKSYYGLAKADILKMLLSILKMTFIELSERELWTATLVTYTNSTLSLEDSYNLEYAKVSGCSEFATYDLALKKRFKKVR